MATFTKWKVFGYFDCLMSVCKLLVTTASVILSTYLYLKNKKHDGHHRFDFAPTLNLGTVALVIHAIFGQILAARKLIKAANNNATNEELRDAQYNWAIWNAITWIMTIIWSPWFGITIYHDHNNHLVYCVACLVLILGIRSAIFCGFYKMWVHNTGNAPRPDIDIELQEMHPGGWI